MQNSLIFIIKALGDLYLLTFLVRFILRWVRADFYNPLAEFILRVTNPLVFPARRVVPMAGGVDLPTLAVLIGLQALLTWLLVTVAGMTVGANTFVLVVLLRLINLALWLYTISIIVYVILSWIGQAEYNPVAGLLRTLNEPLLAPVRRILPPIGGLDLSPLLVLIVIRAVAIAVTQPLPPLLR